jgi:hypothetical protein
MIVVQTQPQLLKVVFALRPARCLAGLLHGRQEQRHQNGNNGNHHQQLDQGEGRRPSRTRNLVCHVDTVSERGKKQDP